MTFTAAEVAYLREQQIGRLCTIGREGQPQVRPVGLHLSPDETSIDIVGHALASTQKWRDVARNSDVAFIVDNVISLTPPDARGVEVRGTATLLPGQGTTNRGLSGNIMRIEPRRIITM